MKSGNSMILVTGGAGYIGFHCCLELLNADFDVTAFDNFRNRHPEARGGSAGNLGRLP